MGGVSGKFESPETKLEAKMVEAMQRRASKGTAIKSFNSIILKFPKIDVSLRNCRAIFEQFDEDSNGAIDPEELKNCLHKLGVCFTEEEINDLFKACDINQDMGIKFNEFIVLLCLVYLLKDNATATEAVSLIFTVCFVFEVLCFIIYPTCHCLGDGMGFSLCLSKKSKMGVPNLEATFETLVDAFVLLDKNKDGYVSKNEMVQAISESGEHSSGPIATKRFEEMDWDKNGAVSFKEFLFAFTTWVGIEDDGDDE
ncbi:putative calcium-binding protein CML21 [Hibiscus syriacus]|uniref:Calcium-binding protein CML21 n=1 Tax=Hibiscus syriacus TaxID=106335 RepID=A0A6A3CHB4_HIBSY|nr:putative calcium-binding protein CML21 [Hibiscus syriacus]